MKLIFGDLWVYLILSQKQRQRLKPSLDKSHPSLIGKRLDILLHAPPSKNHKWHMHRGHMHKLPLTDWRAIRDR